MDQVILKFFLALPCEEMNWQCKILFTKKNYFQQKLKYIKYLLFANIHRSPVKFKMQLTSHRQLQGPNLDEPNMESKSS